MKCKIGKSVPSTRKMSEYISISQNTTRLAYEFLCKEGILESMQMSGNDSNWYLRKIPTITQEELKQIENMSADTLVIKLTDELKIYLASNYSVGDRIPSHNELSSRLNVSVKTINDEL